QASIARLVTSPASTDLEASWSQSDSSSCARLSRQQQRSTSWSIPRVPSPLPAPVIWRARRVNLGDAFAFTRPQTTLRSTHLLRLCRNFEAAHCISWGPRTLRAEADESALLRFAMPFPRSTIPATSHWPAD